MDSTGMTTLSVSMIIAFFATRFQDGRDASDINDIP
jgi:hypothetical protein